MPSILVSVDRRAALLAGTDLGDTCVVDVSRETFGDRWPAFVALLQTHCNPPRLTDSIAVGEANEAAVVAAFDAYQAKEQAEVDARNAKVDAVLDDLAGRLERLRASTQEQPQPETLRVWLTDDEGSRYCCNIAGWQRSLVTVPERPFGLYGLHLTPEQLARRNAINAEAEQLQTAAHAEIEALNEAATEAQRADAIAAAKQQEAEEAAAAELQAREAQEAKERVREQRRVSGHWEMGTPAYNSRRCGPWWCATVTASNRKGDLVYSFGSSVGRNGDAGLLRLPIQPGDIIAWGQKDNRNPRHSEHHLGLVREDWSVDRIEKPEAFRILVARQEQEKAKVLALATASLAENHA